VTHCTARTRGPPVRTSPAAAACLTHAQGVAHDGDDQPPVVALEPMSAPDPPSADPNAERPTAQRTSSEAARARAARRTASRRARAQVCDGIALLQEKWVLHIVDTLLDGPKGFNAIGRAVGGCNPTTLAQRLGRLERLGLITKDADAHHCRARYRLTEAGARLEDVIGAIHRWAAAHLPANGELRS
jgi:DNA-binding HxlR family transcriptional regulator